MNTISELENYQKEMLNLISSLSMFEKKYDLFSDYNALYNDEDNLEFRTSVNNSIQIINKMFDMNDELTRNIFMFSINILGSGGESHTLGLGKDIVFRNFLRCLDLIDCEEGNDILRNKISPEFILKLYYDLGHYIPLYCLNEKLLYSMPTSTLEELCESLVQSERYRYMDTNALYSTLQHLDIIKDINKFIKFAPKFTTTTEIEILFLCVPARLLTFDIIKNISSKTKLLKGFLNACELAYDNDESFKDTYEQIKFTVNLLEEDDK